MLSGRGSKSLPLTVFINEKKDPNYDTGYHWYFLLSLAVRPNWGWKLRMSFFSLSNFDNQISN